RRQSLLFSATMPDEIARLSGEILADPVRVEVTPQATPVERVDQGVYHVVAGNKPALLANILAKPTLARVIVFTRTKHRANRVAKQLGKCGIAAEAIHGNKSQGARQRALAQFRAGAVRVLVATDIAARGIDVDSVSHVINYELPNEPESYIHRIGRTARAGARGTALSFCDPSERTYLHDIERLIRHPLTVITEELAVTPLDRRREGEQPGKGHRHRRDRPAAKAAMAGGPSAQARRRKRAVPPGYRTRPQRSAA
ncbi:MAG: helicase-related protein, partial [Gammaproteobacteria bacterium]|nr:helicase-related protein [Gammaproteobacteria bacterium]